MYRKYLPYLAWLVLLITGCQSQHTPEIENIKISLETKRFEKEFFQLDTNQMANSLKNLKEKYPVFFDQYTDKILGLKSMDSTLKIQAIKKFKHDYQSIYDSAQHLDQYIEPVVSEIKKSFQYIRYYFPDYELPKEFITFIGPIDAFAYGETGGSGEIITTNAICSGLQLHLGKESSIYKSEIGQQLYPAYISQKFTEEYIAVNCIKNIIDDIYTPLDTRNALIDFLIDHGKRMYLLDLLMPFEKDEIKLGYTSAQLKGAIENEGYIWNYFTENKLLYETDYLRIRSFISDGPITAEFGLGSPGFISLFIGKQIVLAYMKEHAQTSLKDLLKLDAKSILNGSKYRPR